MRIPCIYSSWSKSVVWGHLRLLVTSLTLAATFPLVCGCEEESVETKPNGVISDRLTDKAKSPDKSERVGDEKKVVPCNRCGGDKVVDEDDIVRLGKQGDWRPGPCSECDDADTPKEEPLDTAEPATGYKWTALRLTLAQLKWSRDDPSIASKYILRVCSKCAGVVAKGSKISGQKLEEGDPELCDRCLGNGFIFFCRACEASGFNTTQNEKCAACDGEGNFTSKLWVSDVLGQLVEAFIRALTKSSKEPSAGGAVK